MNIWIINLVHQLIISLLPNSERKNEQYPSMMITMELPFDKIMKLS